VVICPKRNADEVSSGARGFLTCRSANGWSQPRAIVILGGGIGWEITGTQTDLMLVTTNAAAAEALKSLPRILGVNPAARAGPLDEEQLLPGYSQQAILFAYQRSSGGVSGLQLGGATIEEDPGTNAELYGRVAPTRTVPASPKVAVDPAIERFLTALEDTR
jgi:lipid-binding SYLF domain-containing protein